MNTVIAIGLASSVALIAAGAHAGVQSYLLGTDAPPDVIGGVQFTPFAPDTQPDVFERTGAITSVAMDGSDPPSGVVVGFSTPVTHYVVSQMPGVPWPTWSHGYTGDVYFTEYLPTVNLLMPPDTQGFRLYVEPNFFVEESFTLTATTDAGSTVMVTELVQGMFGAKGFAFLADPGESLASINITTTRFTGGFAVGEFGIALVPAPATLALLGVVGLGRRRRRLV